MPPLPPAETDRTSTTKTEDSSHVNDNLQAARMERQNQAAEMAALHAQIAETARQAMEFARAIAASLDESGYRDAVVAGFASQHTDRQKYPLYAQIMSPEKTSQV